MLLGGYVGQEQIHFGEKALRLPAKNAPEAAVRVVRRFADEREAGEVFRGWIDRAGGVATIADDLRDLDEFPAPRRRPSTTSTTTRPAPTWPRPASRSARHERYRAINMADLSNARDTGTQRCRDAEDFTDDGAGRAQPRVRAPARLQDHPVGRRHLRARTCA